MPQIGIRKLKNDTSEILRSVREDGVEYVVTHHGRAVAVILPVVDSEASALPPSPELVASLEALRARIAREWASDKTGLEILEDQRR
jgi:prevent-host-death family protein